MSNPSAHSDKETPTGPAIEVSLTVNGQRHVVLADPRTTLLDMLRDRLHLTGTKKGCALGQCGACTVLLDGKPVNACLMLAAMAQDASVITIEGIATNGELHPLQRSFIEHDGLQCGYCTPARSWLRWACCRDRTRRPMTKSAIT